jgi:hypothetical protein
MRVSLVIAEWAVVTALALVFGVVGADYLFGCFGWPECNQCGNSDPTGRSVTTALVGVIIVVGGVAACIFHGGTIYDEMTAKKKGNDR